MEGSLWLLCGSSRGLSLSGTHTKAGMDIVGLRVSSFGGLWGSPIKVCYSHL